MNTIHRTILTDHHVIANDLTADETIVALECAQKIYKRLLAHQISRKRNFEANILVIEQIIKTYTDKLMGSNYEASLAS